MPYTQKQMRLFQAAAHDPEFAKKVGIPMMTARKMITEGMSGRGAVVHEIARKKTKWR